MLPARGEMITRLCTPSSADVWAVFVQFEVYKEEFSCSTKPVDGDGQHTTSVLVELWVMLNSGAPGAWTAATMLQKPPISE